MSDLKFTDWICTSAGRHWVKRMISANGTIDMFTWVSLHQDNLIIYDPNYENMTDEELDEAFKDDNKRVWMILFGDKLEKFQDIYEEMYGNCHRVNSKTAEELLTDIDLFLERVVLLNIFT